MSHLSQTDPEVAAAINQEIGRQQDGVELIPSENFVSMAVLEAMGSVLTNKYSEGYPGRRYYGGNQYIDIVEQLAIDRAKLLFHCDHANVQPHAGSQANMAAYFALIQPGDGVLGLSLSMGGHLTHGSPVNFSGKLFRVASYGVDRETHLIDYDQVAETAHREKPRVIVTGATAYPRQIDFSRFRKIADEVGAFHIADIAHIAGLIATKNHPDAIPYADIVTTTTHKTLRGPRSGMIMCRAVHAAAVDKAVFPLLQGGPLEHMVAAKAVAFGEALQPSFAAYQSQIVKNAKALAKTLADNRITLISGGTDNHLILVDVTPLGTTGKGAEKALEDAGITVNKNTIPYDLRKPFDPSGIRLGTPAVTTRGMKEQDMEVIGQCISAVLRRSSDQDAIKEARKAILGLCSSFPLYEGLKA